MALFSANKIRAAGNDIRDAFGRNNLTFGQKAAKAYSGLAGAATFGAAPELGLSEAAQKVFAPRTAASVPAPVTASGAAPAGPARPVLQGPAVPFDPFTSALATVDNSGIDGGAGGTTAPALKVYRGRQYDLNNPADRIAYNQLTAADADQFARMGEQDAYTAQQRLESDAERQKRTAADELDRRFRDLSTREANYAKGYDDRVTDFGKNYRVSSSNRQNAFASLSPLAYQSAQGQEQGIADQNYAKGLGDLQTEQQQAKEGFTTDRSSLTTDKSNLIDSYNNYLTDTRGALAKNVGALHTKANEFKEGTVAELAPFDVEQGIGNFSDRYQLHDYNPNEVAQVDTAKYAPATSFAGIAVQTGATKDAPFANLGGQIDPLNEYLDRTKDKRQKDPLQQFLYA